MPSEPAKPVVLIVTHSNDHQGVSLVSDAIAERGGCAYRFDTDRFPTEVRLTLEYNGTVQRQVLTDRDFELDLGSVTAVWYRRVATGRQIPMSMEAQLRDAALGECRATVNGMIVSLDAFHLDPLTTVSRADNKQLQLKIARELGMRTPRTLTSNDPAAVRRFAAERPAGLVVKTLSSFAIHEDGNDRVMYTNPVSDADLEHLDSLRYGPCTFQERVPKGLELRATVVGKRVYTAAIDSQQSETSAVDWRRDGIGLIKSWQPYALPADVEHKLLAITHRLGLNYGAADFVVTPDRQHVFLEINPAGEFFWMEKHSPYLPLSNAIAERLLLGECKEDKRALFEIH